VEESIQKATSYAVFEPNTAMTWLKLKTTVESFLESLWRQGGLAGDRAEDAYFVQVGLGTTMTSQDIAEGRLIIRVGMAAVRPAEFIIIEFTHKLQQS
jgi:phage tail sheath protein FI